MACRHKGFSPRKNTILAMRQGMRNANGMRRIAPHVKAERFTQVLFKLLRSSAMFQERRE